MFESNFDEKCLSQILMQNATLPKFEFSIFFKIWFRKNDKSGHHTLKFDVDVEICGYKFKIYFQNSKICTSKFEIRLRFLIFVAGKLILKV